MRRSEIESIKLRIKLMSEAIYVMERCARWRRYTAGTSKANASPHPDDIFNAGQYTAAVKRESMSLSRVLADIRR